MVRIAHFSDLHYGPKNLIEAGDSRPAIES